MTLLSFSLYPTWSQIYAICSRVMELLEENDPDLYHHLKEVSQIGVNYQPNDFVLEAIRRVCDIVYYFMSGSVICSFPG